jgi:hypothetical protein
MFVASFTGGVGVLRGCRYLPAASFFAREYSMRLKFLAAGAALALAACGSGDRADNSVNIGENLFSDSETSNDVTAIDAVTGADANMAADVNYMNAIENGAATSTMSGNNATPSKPGAKPTATGGTTATPAKPTVTTPAPTTAPPTNNTAQ